MQDSIIGVDISKDFLDAAGPGRDRPRRFANDAQGFAALVRLARKRSACVVLEATGGYERGLARALAAAGVPFRRVNARRVRDFAKAAGILAKTDRVDARVIALYGTHVPGPVAIPADPARERLAALVDRRAQLVEERKRLKTQMHAAQSLQIAEIAAEMQTALTGLTQRIRAYEALIVKAIAQSPALARIAARLRSLPGVGPVIAATFTAKCPELGHLDRRAMAALIGLAPFACDSGPRRGQRRCFGGRKGLRDLLYLAALTARKTGPFKALYDRLIAKKTDAKKSALIAVARKLLTLMNVIVARNVDYKPKCA
jgi:transposase